MVSVRVRINFMYRFWVGLRILCSVRCRATVYEDIGLSLVFKPGLNS